MHRPFRPDPHNRIRRTRFIGYGGIQFGLDSQPPYSRESAGSTGVAPSCEQTKVATRLA
jgi:hypothetical protein